MWLMFVCDVLRMVWKICWIIVDVVSWLCCCELCNAIKMVISSLFVWTCHMHCSETWLWKMLCELRKNKKLRVWTISMDVSCAAMNTIFRGTYRALRWILYFEGRITHRIGYYYRGSYHTSRWMHRQICLCGSRTKRQRVCITRSDMHHYTW